MQDYYHQEDLMPDEDKKRIRLSNAKAILAEQGDFVSVVRCENCKHGQKNNYGQLKGHYICEYDQDGPLKHPRHYCGYGERYGDEK